MAAPVPDDRWQNAAAYERYMGRWSRPLARELLSWLDVPPRSRWLEIGCGTGSLTTAICEHADPESVVACDASDDFVRYCRETLRYTNLTVVAATVDTLPTMPIGFDVVASNLVLNFLPDPVEGLRRMQAVCAPAGRVAACVWDYGEGMEFLRVFWDAAVALDPAARPLHEGSRFPLCTRDALRGAFEFAGLRSVEVEPLTVPTPFADFEDYWAPFVNGPGPAPTYVSSLSEERRARLADRLREQLFGPTQLASRLTARAWAAKAQAGTAGSSESVKGYESRAR